MAAASAAAGLTSVWWLRKGLRLHDNPALLRALEGATAVHPLFILDPAFLSPSRVGLARLQFLLESLADLDASLRRRNSRLIVLHGKPAEVLPAALAAWRVNRLCFEWDAEPYALARDGVASEQAGRLGCEVFTPVSNTLYDPRAIIAANKGKPPLVYASFCKLADKLGPPPQPASDPPASFPAPHADAEALVSFPSGIPTAAALGYHAEPLSVAFRGGETEALRRLDAHMARTDWVAAFQKPNTSPTALIQPLAAKPSSPFAAAAKAPSSAAQLLSPSTTGLSPYLKFGCLSSRLFATRLLAIERAAKAPTAPPVSLRGQLLWRDFFTTAQFGTPNFERMRGNAMCRQIDWDADTRLLASWEDGRTGHPFIDAAMTQLRTQGWLHHLARHSVACFLTRGDLWQSWEAGAAVFDRLLLDADPSLNAGNWMWLSCSAFFHQYFRVYSPIAFPKKYDPEGVYVRHFLPALRKMPAKYIYEPWKAPLAVQQAAGCIVGQDYPSPVVDHAVASKANIERMAKAFAANKAAAGGEQDDDDDDAGPAQKKPRGAK